MQKVYSILENLSSKNMPSGQNRDNTLHLFGTGQLRPVRDYFVRLQFRNQWTRPILLSTPFTDSCIPHSVSICSFVIHISCIPCGISKCFKSRFAGVFPQFFDRLPGNLVLPINSLYLNFIMIFEITIEFYISSCPTQKPFLHGPQPHFEVSLHTFDSHVTLPNTLA